MSEMKDGADRLAAVRECFRDALTLDDAVAAAIDEETEAADLAAWDSQGHIRLIIALETRFGVQLADDEIVELVSVDAILKALDRSR